MGHVLLGPLPRSLRWNEVVRVVTGGGSVKQVANATVAAAETGLARGGQDAGVIEAVWLLTQIPLAAKADDFVGALRRCGLDVNDSPDLFELASAVMESVDRALANCRGRTDLGEMAQTAAAETLHSFAGARLKSLFHVGPEDVQHEFAKLATVKNFGQFARHFFGRFMGKALRSFLSRTLPLQIGDGKRFRTLTQHTDFERALDSHCHEAALIVERFAGQWMSKENWYTGGQIERSGVAKFTSYAMKKLTDELKEGADLGA